MNAKHSSLRWFAALPIALLTLTLFAGCPDGDDGITPPEYVDTNDTLIIADGRQPVWVNDASFLFNYASETGTDGIFLSDLEGNVTEVYGGVHNHDYVASPSGDYAAFSTPDLDGGVYYIDLTILDPVLLMTGAKHPSFLTDDLLVVENEAGHFGMVAINNPGTFTEYSQGAYPVASADGGFVAYTYSLLGSGVQLQIFERQGLDIFEMVSNVGVDHVWHPDGTRIYVSQLVDGTLTDVIEIPVANPDEFTTLISGGTRPSVSRDGIHLFADNVEAGRNDGIIYHNLETGRVESIRYAQRPAAAITGTALLAEKTPGIYYITFE